MIIVTLSSIPSRFRDLSMTLNSLLKQTIQPDKIELYIPKKYKRFPDWDGTLPNLPKGIDLVMVDSDFGPATKILPAIQRYKKENPIIIFCDDDREYHPKWVESFIKIQKKKPNFAIANVGSCITRKPFSKRVIKVRTIFDVVYRFKRIFQTIHNWISETKKPKPPRFWRYIKGGCIDIMEGFGGCLVRPKMFDDSFFKIPKLAWPHDDIWISGKLAQKGIEIWLNPNGKLIQNQYHDVEDALNEGVFFSLNRKQLTSAVIDFMKIEFKIWE